MKGTVPGPAGQLQKVSRHLCPVPTPSFQKSGLAKLLDFLSDGSDLLEQAHGLLLHPGHSVFPEDLLSAKRLLLLSQLWGPFTFFQLRAAAEDGAKPGSFPE